MWRSKFQSFFIILILVLIGLTPLLWFKPGFMAAGHDMGYSFDPLSRINSEFYAWSDAMTLGSDVSMNLGAKPLYLVEASLQWLGFSNRTGQIIVFIFWFMLPGLAMYFLLKTLADYMNFPQHLRFSFFLVGSLFYSFNHYLLQAWFVASKQEFSLVIVTPILLAFLFRILVRKNRPLSLGILGALLLSFFNAGGANGLPIFAGLIICLFWFVLYFSFIKYFKKQKINLVGAYQFLLVLGVAFFLFNAYWLLPLGYYAFSHYGEQLKTTVGGIGGVLDWIKLVSHHSSFSNLFRLQGFSGWYETQNHPYSSVFLENTFFIFLSFLWPLFFFLSLLIKRRNKNDKETIGFFFGLALVTIFFMSGSKSPFGFIYKALVRYLPGFAILRTPFYKFGYPLWLAYAILIAYSFTNLTDRLSRFLTKVSFRRIFIKTVAVFIFIFLIGLYNYPFFTGIFFEWNRPLATMIKPPDYVFKFQEFLNNLESEGRVLLYPPLSKIYSADTYDWNYWSLTSFPNLLTEKSVISNNIFMNKYQRSALSQFYKTLKAKDQGRVMKLAKILNIKYLLFRKDVKTDLSWDLSSPIKNYFLDELSWLIPLKDFDDWTVYKLSDGESEDALALKTSVVSLNEMEHLDKMNDEIMSENIFFSDFDFNEDLKVPVRANIVTSNCNSCDLKLSPHYFSDIKARFLPNSSLYKLVLIKERIKLWLTKNDYDKEFLLVTYIVKRLDEIDSLLKKFSDDQDQSLIEHISKAFNQTEKLIDELITVRLSQQDGEPINYSHNEYIYAFGDFSKDKLSTIQSFYYLPELEEELEEVSNKLNQLERMTEEKLWWTQTPDSLRFLAKIEEAGDYEVLLVPNEGLDYELLFEKSFLDSARIKLAEKEATLSARRIGKSGYEFGSVHLSPEVYKIAIDIPQYTNLLSFLPEFEIPPHGEPLLVNLSSIYPEQDYLLSFNYKKESFRNLSISLFARLNSGEKIKINHQRLTKGLEKNQRILFNTPVDTAEIVMRFDYEDRSKKSLPLGVENLTFHPLIHPTVIFYTEQDYATLSSSPQITKAKEINPTFYQVDIENANVPSFLLLKQGFDQDWKAYLLREKIPFKDCQNIFCLAAQQIFIGFKGEPLDESIHFKAYGWANSWYLDPEQLDESQFSLGLVYFFPMVVTYLGFSVSFFILGITVIILVKKILERKLK